ncbi:MAG: hypothetical protein JJLCMIEE_00853 [Acidimicrobiales bacterium]|nr:hypothetical protein [Acidimicrobiales bacterium]
MASLGDVSDPPSLEELYHPDTVALIDRGLTPAELPRPRRVRATASAGAMVLALGLGIQQVLEPEEAEPEVAEITPDGLPDPAASVLLYLVPDDPPASLAVIRRQAAIA